MWIPPPPLLRRLFRYLNTNLSLSVSGESVHRPRATGSDLPDLLARLQYLRARDIASQTTHRDHLPTRGQPEVGHSGRITSVIVVIVVIVVICAVRKRKWKWVVPTRPRIGRPSPLFLSCSTRPSAERSPNSGEKGGSEGNRDHPGSGPDTG